MSIPIFETKERVLADNLAAADENRAAMAKNGTVLVNLMGSPGAGKTSVILRLIERLGKTYQIGVMEADVDSDVDAKTVAAAGAKAVQLHTGGLCHMDADMTGRGLDALGVEGLDIVFLENIGNLVCPAEFEVGADVRLMLLSVPEGDDKPLKYPLMFSISDVLLVTKTDVMPVFDFDLDKMTERVRALNENIRIFPVSAKKDEGFEGVVSFLEQKILERRALSCG